MSTRSTLEGSIVDSWSRFPFQLYRHLQREGTGKVSNVHRLTYRSDSRRMAAAKPHKSQRRHETPRTPSCPQIESIRGDHCLYTLWAQHTACCRRPPMYNCRVWKSNHARKHLLFPTLKEQRKRPSMSTSVHPTLCLLGVEPESEMQICQTVDDEACRTEMQSLTSSPPRVYRQYMVRKLCLQS